MGGQSETSSVLQIDDGELYKLLINVRADSQKDTELKDLKRITNDYSQINTQLNENLRYQRAKKKFEYVMKSSVPVDVSEIHKILTDSKEWERLDIEKSNDEDWIVLENLDAQKYKKPTSRIKVPLQEKTQWSDTFFASWIAPTWLRAMKSNTVVMSKRRNFNNHISFS